MAGIESAEDRVDFLLCVLKSLDDNSKPDLETVASERGLSSRANARATLKKLAAASTSYELNAQNRIVFKAGINVPSSAKDKVGKTPRKKAVPKSKKPATNDEPDTTIKDSEAAVDGIEVASEKEEHVVNGAAGSNIVNHQFSPSAEVLLSDAYTPNPVTPCGTSEPVTPGAPGSHDVTNKSEPILEGSITPTPTTEDGTRTTTDSSATTPAESAAPPTKKRGRPASTKKNSGATAAATGKGGKEGNAKPSKDAEDDDTGNEGSATKKVKRGSIGGSTTEATTKPKKVTAPRKKRETKKQEEAREKKEAEEKAIAEPQETEEDTADASANTTDDDDTGKSHRDRQVTAKKQKGVEADAIIHEKSFEMGAKKLYQQPALKVTTREEIAAGVEDENEVVSTASVEKNVPAVIKGDELVHAKEELVKVKENPIVIEDEDEEDDEA